MKQINIYLVEEAINSLQHDLKVTHELKTIMIIIITVTIYNFFLLNIEEDHKVI